MNVERLLQFVEFLQQQEKHHQIQQKLADFQANLNNQVNQPQQVQFQSQVAATLTALEKTIHNFYDVLNPAQIKSIVEIKGDEFFFPKLVETIKIEMSKNAMTPAVVRDYVNRIVGQRQEFLQNLQITQQGLTKLGIKTLALTPGQSEIGFLIPRELFHNELDQLLKELTVIKLIIGFFSEVTTGGPQKIEVHQLSSTDPLIFLGLVPKIIIALAAGPHLSS